MFTVNTGVSVTSGLRSGAAPSIKCTWNTNPVLGDTCGWEQTRLCCVLNVSAPWFPSVGGDRFVGVYLLGCTGSYWQHVGCFVATWVQ